MRQYQQNNNINLLMTAAIFSLVGCGGGDVNNSQTAGVSTGGTGTSISPGLGGGGDGDVNTTLNTNPNNSIIVNSPTQPPLLPTEAHLSIAPLRLVQTQEDVKFYSLDNPSVIKYNLATNLKKEGVLATVDGAMVLFSTPSQTGYQIISFDGGGTPLASKIYGVDGKVMALRYQKSTNNSYFIDLLINDDHSTSSKPYNHQRFKIVDGVMTSGKKTLDLQQKIIKAVNNEKSIVWIGQDTQANYWLNALQCTENTTVCTQLVPVKLQGSMIESDDNPRSMSSNLSLNGDDIQLKMSISDQTVNYKFAIIGANVVTKP